MVELAAERPVLRLASGNAHKLSELRSILPDWRIEPLERAEYPPETGATYRDNARLKALYGRPLAGLDEWVVGEDSGIEAAALGGRPGIESARWAADGVARLLEELAGASDRRGRYVCALVAVGPGGEEVAVEATLEGRIEGPPRGAGGFGYDPILVPEGEVLTVAELGNTWKQAGSHRAKAARLLVRRLTTLEQE